MTGLIMAVQVAHVDVCCCQVFVLNKWDRLGSREPWSMSCYPTIPIITRGKMYSTSFPMCYHFFSAFVSLAKHLLLASYKSFISVLTDHH